METGFLGAIGNGRDWDCDCGGLGTIGVSGMGSAWYGGGAESVSASSSSSTSA